MSIGRAAVVTGVDLSTNMLRIARHRVRPDVALHHADLRAPLPFDDHAFDLVLSSLVMHYLPAWEPTLDEFHRLLVPHGRLVLSTRHPFADQRISGTDDYFGTYAFTDTWIRNGRRMPMRFWHRPLRAMLAAFHSTGFTVDDITEPDPQPGMASIDPITYRKLSRTHRSSSSSPSPADKANRADHPGRAAAPGPQAAPRYRADVCPARLQSNPSSPLSAMICSHQLWFSAYQRTVSAMPDSNSCTGRQPSPVSSFSGLMT
ncbi:methyltransferase domain-containing protein [Nocardia terpenica]|uniref:Methyltransferase domain-containing protein n=1 Tax=Nocardia terpenica TaxID=455432 RepID=A0A6G9ZGF8_9NOCA|nr:methyltransferase domain-containing protein [Nocardia terpenica]